MSLTYWIMGLAAVFLILIFWYYVRERKSK